MTNAVALKVGNVVLDTPRARALAEFYRGLLSWSYRPGDEPPPAGEPDARGDDWLVLRNPDGGMGLAFQQVEQLTRSTWPDGTVPQQLHLDLTVPDVAALHRFRETAQTLGAQVLQDRSDDEQEPLFVLADPDGHPFCIFVA